MALAPDDVAGLIQAALITKPDIYELPKTYKNVVGQSLEEAKQILGIKNLNELASMYPDLFSLRGGCLVTIKSDDMAEVVDQMNRTTGKSKSRGSRGGGYRGSRAGGTSGRGGYVGNYGAAFRGSRGGATGGGGYRGGSARGGSSYNSFGSGGGGGFGSGGGGFGSSGFGNGGGGFGNGRGNESSGFGTDSRRRDDSPPRRSPPRRSEYSSSRGNDSYNQRSGNSGFSSNYDDFAETTSSRRRGSVDYDDGRNNSSSNYRDRDSRDGGYNDGYRNNDRNDRDAAPSRGRHYDDDYYGSDRGAGGGRGGRDDRYDATSRTVKNEFYDDRSTPRREERGGYGSNDGGYRNQQQQQQYSEDEDEWDYNRGRRRVEERDERGTGRGGGSNYGSNRDHDSRQDDRYEDRYRRDYEDEEEQRAAEPRKAFPSAFNPASLPRSGFMAPQPMHSDDDENASSSRRARGGDTPPDPIQPGERVRPIDPSLMVPPGFEDALRAAPPPGLGYTVSPPPGLGGPRREQQREPQRDPMKKTPTQRAHEDDPSSVPLEDFEELVFTALLKEGGRQIKDREIIGKILEHCDRDVSSITHQHGGVSGALEKLSKRYDKKYEFDTNDDAEDVIMLLEPYLTKAWEEYGRGVRDEAEYTAAPPDHVESDTDDDDDYRSVRSAPPPPPDRFANSRPAPPAVSRAAQAPVKAEINTAEDLWQIACSGRWNSRRNASEIALSTLVKESGNNMTPAGMIKFLSQPAFRAFFDIQFEDDPQYTKVYALGRHGPAVLLDGESSSARGSAARDDRTIREDRSARAVSTVSGVSRGSGSRADPPRDERRDDPPPSRPSFFKFFHRKDDPDMGEETIRSYKQRENVMLTHFHNFDDFYVASTRDWEKYQRLTEDLYDDHKGLPPCDLDRWQKSHVGCYVNTQEQRGYRIVVINVVQEDETNEFAQLHVRYVDTGKRAKVFYRDVVPLRETYKSHALCYRCSLERNEVVDEDEIWDLRNSLSKLKPTEAVIEPKERNWEDKILVVTLSFTPPDAIRQYNYPDELYRKNICKPVDLSY